MKNVFKSGILKLTFTFFFYFLLCSFIFNQVVYAKALDNSKVNNATAPTGYSVKIEQTAINSKNNNSLSFVFTGAEKGAIYNYIISSSNGKSAVGGSGTVNDACQQITNIDVSGLKDGMLTLSLTLTDAAGNVGNAATDTVKLDTNPPLITLKGESDFKVELGSTYTDAGATAVDALDGNVAVTSDISNLNTSKLGNYTVTYTAVDKSGNIATAARNVEVVSLPASNEDSANASISKAVDLLPSTFTASYGKDTNLIASLKNINGIDATGASITVVSANANVSNNGTINYLKDQSIGNVVVHINKTNGIEQTKTIKVIVPAYVENTSTDTSNAGSNVKRLSGSSRIDTAIEIAKATYTEKVSNVVLATASDYPDALAGSVLAYKLNAPILLIGNSDEEQNKVLAYIKANMDVAGTIYILGGNGAVSKAAEDKIYNSGYKNIIRLAGVNRYETSVKIAEAAVLKTGTPIVLVSGNDYPDALSVSSSAAINQYPVLLVDKKGITDELQKEIVKINPSKVYIIGLQGAVNSSVESQITKAVNIDAANIIRIGGRDRYETSFKTAKYFNLTGKIACIATGSDFPDALAGSLYAAKNNAPVLLAGNTLSSDEMLFVKDKKLTGITIFGGEGAVGAEVQKELENRY